MQLSYDVSGELVIRRFGAGMKLMRPCKTQVESSTSLRSVLQLPFNVYFLNTNSVIQAMSEETANICGFLSRRDAIGSTARRVSKKESADFSIGHNNEVLQKRKMIIKDEHFLRLDDFSFRDVAIKFPLFNTEEKLIGVFGCSIIIDQYARCSLAQALTILTEIGLLTQTNQTHSQVNHAEDLYQQLSSKTNLSFSRKEITCLFYLMNGKTAAETANAIHLSRRTVEYYWQILKEKFHCNKKSLLIEAVLMVLSTH